MNKPIKPSPEKGFSATLRGPLELRQYEPGACATVCMANALHMFGFEFPISDPRYIDQQVGRQPGQPQNTNRLLLYALEHGLTLHRVDTFDDERFFEKGRAYLEEAYPEIVGPDFYQHWTDEQVALRQAARQTECQSFAAYQTDTREIRPPDIATDIIKPLTEGKLVLFSQSIYSKPTEGHAVLAYGISEVDGYVDLYQPRQAAGTEVLIGVDESWIKECWSPEDGVNILSI